MITEELLEEERQRMRQEYESEMEELRKKMASEKETKAKMQTEIEKMKLDYEEKMKGLEQRAQTAKMQRDQQVNVKWQLPIDLNLSNLCNCPLKIIYFVSFGKSLITTFHKFVLNKTNLI